MTDKATILQTRALLSTIAQLPANANLVHPIALLEQLMLQVAARALEIDDKGLHKLMLQLGLYSIADATCPEYSPDIVGAMLS